MVGGLTVFGNRTLNLNIFWKVTSYRIQSYLWNFLKCQCSNDIKRSTQKHCFAKIGLLPRVNYWSGAINIGNGFITSPSKSVCNFPDVVWFFFYKLLKFDIVNADVPFYKRGHNFKMEAKLNKSRHSFSKEVSLSILARLDHALTDVGTVQFTTTMAYDNLK